jgi:hypothetical protein
VRIRRGVFAGMEAQVVEVPAGGNRVRVSLTLFGRTVPIDLDYCDLDGPPMTEEEWQTCHYAGHLFAFLCSQPEPSRVRKARLCACACARRVWHHLPDNLHRKAIRAAERFADRRGWLRGIARAVRRASEEAPDPDPDPSRQVARSVVQVATAFGEELWQWPAFVLASKELSGLAPLIREVFGNPFQPVTFDLAWLAINGGSVRKLAELIYQDRQFDAMPILGDALEDAGCADAMILEHCRGGNGHVRGCWVVDGLLGKK